MNYTWKIVYVSDIETVGQNALQKRNVVLEEVTDKDYKGWIAFDLIKDKVNMTDKFKVWDIVDVSLNFKTSYAEVSKRYFTNITAWKIEKVDTWLVESSDDDLPF